MNKGNIQQLDNVLKTISMFAIDDDVQVFFILQKKRLKNC